MSTNLKNEDGYELWLRYRQVADAARLAQYREALPQCFVPGEGATFTLIKSELARALPGLLGQPTPLLSSRPGGPALVAGTFADMAVLG